MSLVYNKFLMFGDSITEFAFKTGINEESNKFILGSTLTNIYTRKLEIIQRGFSGYNSRWALKILPSILESESNIILGYIFFGSNDAVLEGIQKVSLSEFKQNIIEMINIFRVKNIKPIIVGPGLHDQDKWASTGREDDITCIIRSNENNKLYSDTLLEISQITNTPFVNLFDAFTREGGEDWRDLLCDGLHYSSKGYKVFFNELMETINKHYPECSPENIPYKLPNWRLLDAEGSMLELWV